MALAGFSVGEAEGLRRAMSRKRSAEALEAYRARFVEGAPRKGVDARDGRPRLRQARRLLGLRLPEVARGRLRRCSPTSRPGCATTTRPSSSASLLNAQPMGFYPPAALVRDAQRRGVEVRPPDVNAERRRRARVEDGAVRIGLALVRSLGEDGREGARRGAGAGGAFARRRRPRAAQRRSTSATGSSALVAAGACDSLRQAAARRCSGSSASRRAAQSVPGSGGKERQLALPLDADRGDAGAARADRLGADARRLPARPALSVGVHPLALLRAAPAARHARLERDLAGAPERLAASASPAWSSPASARRRRTASSSCCSRTSTAR